MIALYYAAALVAIGIYAILFGGWEGRATVAVIASLFGLSVAMTWIIRSDLDYQRAAFGIDLVSLMLKCAIAMLSRRRWPIIIAAFQLNAICAQAALLVAPAFKTQFHYAMMTIWAVPTLLTLGVGTYLDRRNDRLATDQE